MTSLPLLSITLNSLYAVLRRAFAPIWVSASDRLSLESKQTNVAVCLQVPTLDLRERWTSLSTNERRRTIALRDVIGFCGMVDDHGVVPCLRPRPVQFPLSFYQKRNKKSESTLCQYLNIMLLLI